LSLNFVTCLTSALGWEDWVELDVDGDDVCPVCNSSVCWHRCCLLQWM